MLLTATDDNQILYYHMDLYKFNVSGLSYFSNHGYLAVQE